MGTEQSVTTGIKALDQVLGGLRVGDNILWYDDAGSLAILFSHHFIETSLKQNHPVIYASFDRSPRNLLERLGAVARNPNFILMDCFTSGKGQDAPTFQRFYEKEARQWPCRIVKIMDPSNMEIFMQSLYALHNDIGGELRFVFESITGMQELWGGEEELARFYNHSCPRLYELNTVAYWIIEKRAHSPRIRAQLNHMAQVVVELSIKRGTTSLTVVKAEGRDLPHMGEPIVYWTNGTRVIFETEKRPTDRAGIGQRLKSLRMRRGLSQSELARRVGLTPSSISQVESNLIYPSIPALLKMAEVLQVPISSFFADRSLGSECPVFTQEDASPIKPGHLPAEKIRIQLLTPLEFGAPANPYRIEIPPKTSFSGHFFQHKGAELGYVTSGAVTFRTENRTCTARTGDLIYLTTEVPLEWQNTDPEPVELLWITIA